MLGGIPASLGGGGLEVQIRETMAALRARSHEVLHLSSQSDAVPFEILHAFGSEPDVCHLLQHWRLNRTPLVCSPVLVLPPGSELRELVAMQLPFSTLAAHGRAQLIRRADLVVAQTHHERRFLRRIGAKRTALVANGVRRAPTGALPPGVPPHGTYALMLGAVCRRKRQVDVMKAIAGAIPLVIVGGFQGTAVEYAEFSNALRRSSSTLWLGEIKDSAQVHALIAGASALVHVSRAEGQALAVLEALSIGTPVVTSPLPSMVELASSYPDLLYLVRRTIDVPAALERMIYNSRVPQPIPTWDDVAMWLEAEYETVLGSSPSEET